MRTMILAATGVMLVAGLAGCANTEQQRAQTAAEAGNPDQVVNTTCPIGKHEWDGTNIRSADLRRDYKGTRIGFCCEHCVDAFDTMTAAEQDQVRQAALANKPMD